MSLAQRTGAEREQDLIKLALAVLIGQSASAASKTADSSILGPPLAFMIRPLPTAHWIQYPPDFAFGLVGGVATSRDDNPDARSAAPARICSGPGARLPRSARNVSVLPRRRTPRVLVSAPRPGFRPRRLPPSCAARPASRSNSLRRPARDWSSRGPSAKSSPRSSRSRKPWPLISAAPPRSRGATSCLPGTCRFSCITAGLPPPNRVPAAPSASAFRTPPATPPS